MCLLHRLLLLLPCVGLIQREHASLHSTSLEAGNAASRQYLTWTIIRANPSPRTQAGGESDESEALSVTHSCMQRVAKLDPSLREITAKK